MGSALAALRPPLERRHLDVIRVARHVDVVAAGVIEVGGNEVMASLLAVEDG